MRKEPFGVGSFVHVVKRGTRGVPIVRDEDDRLRFLLMLAHFNDEHQPANWFRDIDTPELPEFGRPTAWPDQKQIVRTISFCLLTNHLHLILQEVVDGGIAKFMQRLGTAMTMHYNEKYEEQGSLFQGSYRSRTIDADEYLRYAIAYVQLKNVLEALNADPHGAFPSLYERASNYRYASLGDHLGVFDRPIVDVHALREIMPVEEFRMFSRDFLSGRNAFEQAVPSLE